MYKNKENFLLLKLRTPISINLTSQRI